MRPGRLWDGFCEALAFLTCLPVPAGRSSAPSAGLKMAVPWFPAAGAVVGAVAALACWGGDVLCGSPVGAALAVVAGLLVTRALHADGLADTVDGLAGGSGDRIKALRIMRDSRIGSLGAAALIGDALLRFASLSAAAPPWRWYGLVCAAVTGRTAVVLALSRFPYARPQGGMGTPFAGGVSPVGMGFALLTGVTGLFFAGGLTALPAAAAALAAGLTAAALIARAVGGLTGDGYGAVCGVTEVVFLLIWAAYS